MGERIIALETSEYTEWLTAHKIGRHPEYSHEQVFLPLDIEWLWYYPRSRKDYVPFLRAVFDACDPWATCLVDHRFLGLFHWNGETKEWAYEWTRKRFESWGILLGDSSVVCFNREDPRLYRSLKLELSLGRDVYVIPDHARQMLQFDHDIGLRVHFAGPEGLAEFVQSLKERQIFLPERQLRFAEDPQILRGGVERCPDPWYYPPEP
jgi:hypothetical protein